MVERLRDNTPHASGTAAQATMITRVARLRGPSAAPLHALRRRVGAISCGFPQEEVAGPCGRLTGRDGDSIGRGSSRDHVGWTPWQMLELAPRRIHREESKAPIRQYRLKRVEVGAEVRMEVDEQHDSGV